MALDRSNGRNLEQLALKGLMASVCVSSGGSRRRICLSFLACDTAQDSTRQNYVTSAQLA